jgi:hypothetical protein
VAVDESLGGAVDYVAFLVAPVVELAREFAFERAGAKVEGPSFVAAVGPEGVVDIVAGAEVVNTEGAGFAAVLVPGSAEACSLGSGIWMVLFAAEKAYVG